MLVGDPAQIGAVRAPGGMLEHLTTPDPAARRGARRAAPVAHRWEAAATLALRAGDAAVLDVYRDHDRIHPAVSGDDAADAVFERWHTAVDAGVDALMLARGWADVTALNTRARAAAIATGEVSGPVLLEVTARTASSRGRPETRDYRAGDVLMAKKNTRDLEVGGQPVRNGDRFKSCPPPPTEGPGRHGPWPRAHGAAGRVCGPACRVRWAATIDAAQGATTGIAVTPPARAWTASTLRRHDPRPTGEPPLHRARDPAADAGPHHHGTEATVAITATEVEAAQDNPAPSREVQAEAFEQLARALATTGRERAAHSLLAPPSPPKGRQCSTQPRTPGPQPDLPREHERNLEDLQQASAERDRGGRTSRR